MHSTNIIGKLNVALLEFYHLMKLREEPSEKVSDESSDFMQTGMRKICKVLFIFHLNLLFSSYFFHLYIFLRYRSNSTQPLPTTKLNNFLEFLVCVKIEKKMSKKKTFFNFEEKGRNNNRSRYTRE
jgi:hypothetical protein